MDTHVNESAASSQKKKHQPKKGSAQVADFVQTHVIRHLRRRWRLALGISHRGWSASWAEWPPWVKNISGKSILWNFRNCIQKSQKWRQKLERKNEVNFSIYKKWYFEAIRGSKSPFENCCGNGVVIVVVVSYSLKAIGLKNNEIHIKFSIPQTCDKDQQGQNRGCQTRLNVSRSFNLFFLFFFSFFFSFHRISQFFSFTHFSEAFHSSPIFFLGRVPVLQKRTDHFMNKLP